MDKTTKIDNDHADEQIEVEGSSISSKSEDAGDHDEFRNALFMQRNRSSPPDKMPTHTTTPEKSPWRAPMSPHNTPIFPSAQTSRSYSSPSRGTNQKMQIHSCFARTGHPSQGICARIHPRYRRSRCLLEDAKARSAARDTGPVCVGRN